MPTRHGLTTFALIVTAILALTTTVTAQFLYVDDDAPSAGDGQSWPTAFRFLQDALTVANAPKSGITEIRIAQGAYSPDRDEANPTGTADDEATFILSSNLALRGGYAGIGAPDPDANDPELYETILSGEIGDPDETFDNSQMLIQVESATGVSIEGLTLAHAVRAVVANSASILFGNCTIAQNYQGMLLESSTLGLTECDFLENSNFFFAFGAAAGMTDCEATFTSCNFTDNIAWNFGGALYADDSTLTLGQCSFLLNDPLQANPPEEGGFVYSRFGSLSVTDCSFESENIDNPVALRRGGAIRVWNPSVAPSFIDCTFTRMRTGSFGADLGAAGGAVDISDFSANASSVTTFVDCVFSQCVASVSIPPDLQPQCFGGAVFVQGRPVIFENCSFTGNVSRQGAAITCFAPANLHNCTFTDNLAISSITDFWYQGSVENCSYINNRAGYSTFVMAPNGGSSYSIALSNCNFIGNTAYVGSAINTYGSSTQRPTLAAANCLFIGNRGGGAMNRAAGGVIQAWKATVELDNCTVAYNSAEGDFGGALALAVESNASIDNCILWENGADGEPQFFKHPGDEDTIVLTVNHSIIDGLTGSLGGLGNIDANPIFVAQPNDGGDGLGDDPNTPDIDESANDDYGDLHVMLTSPAIDAGWNNAVPLDVNDMDDDGDVNEFIPFDLDGLPRFAQVAEAPDAGCGIGAIVDMGAYEYQGVPMQPTYGDVNGDQLLDMRDLVAMLAAWGECMDNCCIEDINADGVIDILDLLTALGVWE